MANYSGNWNFSNLQNSVLKTRKKVYTLESLVTKELISQVTFLSWLHNPSYFVIIFLFIIYSHIPTIIQLYKIFHKLSTSCSQSYVIQPVTASSPSGRPTQPTYATSLLIKIFLFYTYLTPSYFVSL